MLPVKMIMLMIPKIIAIKSPFWLKVYVACDNDYVDDHSHVIHFSSPCMLPVTIIILIIPKIIAAMLPFWLMVYVAYDDDVDNPCDNCDQVTILAYGVCCL